MRLVPFGWCGDISTTPLGRSGWVSNVERMSDSTEYCELPELWPDGKGGLSAQVASQVGGAKHSVWRKAIFDRATGAVFDLSRWRDRPSQQRRRSTTSRGAGAAGSPVDGRRTA